MATGDLNDSIQESLDLVVSDGCLNNGTAVCHESDLNPKKNQAKFDVQNPIIGSLLKQIDSSKITSKGIKKHLKHLTQKLLNYKTD